MGVNQENDDVPIPKEPKGKAFVGKGITSGKPTDQVLTSWPDADAAAGTGEPAPTEEELLEDHIDEELLMAIPNLDAARRSSATPKAMAARRL
eukprot:874680-Karenia_brevis.AAC.1